MMRSSFSLSVSLSVLTVGQSNSAKLPAPPRRSGLADLGTDCPGPADSDLNAEVRDWVGSDPGVRGQGILPGGIPVRAAATHSPGPVEQRTGTGGRASVQRIAGLRGARVGRE